VPTVHGPESEVPSGAERRRTKRIPLAFQVEVSGREPKGGLFQDQAVTIDVNEAGCRFDLERQLNRGDVVTIRVVQSCSASNRPTRFQVVWAEPADLGWTIGVMKLRDEAIWPRREVQKFLFQEST
jgi:PilZ domain